MCPEIGWLFSLFWCAKDGSIQQFSKWSHFVVNVWKVPKTSTICRLLMVNSPVLWLVSNGSLVAEIWVFQVLGSGYVYLCMCMYHKVYAGICRYTNGCACSVCTFCPIQISRYGEGEKKVLHGRYMLVWACMCIVLAFISRYIHLCAGTLGYS